MEVGTQRCLTLGVLRSRLGRALRVPRGHSSLGDLELEDTAAASCLTEPLE